MALKKICSGCKHYTQSDSPEDENYQFAGRCELMGDANSQTPRVSEDRASGWDYEGYAAGVYVGPKFGCIHWMKKEAYQCPDP